MPATIGAVSLLLVANDWTRMMFLLKGYPSTTMALTGRRGIAEIDDTVLGTMAGLS